MKIRVDNLSADITDEDLRTLFECFGRVAAVEMSKRGGGAQVEMPSKSAAKEAIAGLDGQNLKGYDLAVAEMAKHRPSHQGQKSRRRRRR